MADKATRLILDALNRAAAEPAGLPLFNGKAEVGLFPATALARTVAQRCRDDGFLKVLKADDPEIYGLTEKGLDHLLNQSSPKQVIEDFVRVLEARQTEVVEMSTRLDRLRGSIDGMHATLRVLLPRLGGATPSSTNGQASPSPADSNGDYASILLQKLTDWRKQNFDQDCPLPQLYRQAMIDTGKLGAFHDALRKLHQMGKVALHPWTGPLYALPEPAFALLIGHEIAYYANVI